jgi:hypothetical protein
LILTIWWVKLIRIISKGNFYLLLSYFEAECQTMEKFHINYSTIFIKIVNKLHNGFQIILKVQFAIFLLEGLKCQQWWFQIQHLFKKCSRELVSNLILCLKGKNFYIVTWNKEWMNNNLYKASPIFTIWFPTIKGTKILLEMDKCCNK